MDGQEILGEVSMGMKRKQPSAFCLYFYVLLCCETVGSIWEVVSVIVDKPVKNSVLCLTAVKPLYF